MGQVTIQVNGRDYALACDDGEEPHVRELADFVNARLSQLVEGVGQVGESRLLLMTALMIADELSDALERIEDGETGTPALMAAMTERIEKIAARAEAV